MADNSDNWRVKSPTKDSPFKPKPKPRPSDRDTQPKTTYHPPLSPQPSSTSSNTIIDRDAPASAPADSKDEFWGEEREVHNNGMVAQKDALALKGITEGTRLYVGNLDYIVKVRDLEELFGEYGVENIDMTVDPFTGRNTSFCFIDFSSKENAEKALNDLNGTLLLRRPLKMNTAVLRRGLHTSTDGKKAYPASSRKNNSSSLVFNGWNRKDAGTHWKAPAEEGRRLFVGGLPNLGNHKDVNERVGDIFEGYPVQAISKMISPVPPKPRGFYVFVDMESREMALKASKALNRKVWEGHPLTVNIADKERSRKVDERAKWDRMYGQEKQEEET